MQWEAGGVMYAFVYRGTNNKVLLGCTGNCNQHPKVNYNGKAYFKRNACVCVCVHTELNHFGDTTEFNTAL